MPNTPTNCKQYKNKIQKRTNKFIADVKDKKKFHPSLEWVPFIKQIRKNAGR